MVGEGQSEEMERAGFWQMNLSLFEHWEKYQAWDRTFLVRLRFFFFIIRLLYYNFRDLFLFLKYFDFVPLRFEFDFCLNLVYEVFEFFLLPFLFTFLFFLNDFRTLLLTKLTH